MPFTFHFGGFDPNGSPFGMPFGGRGAGQGAGQGAAGPRKSRPARKPIGTAVTRTIINLAVTLLQRGADQ